MSSLRGRVLASVLALAAIGMIVLATIVYAEQRSFLQGRIDQEVRSAGPAVSQALETAGYPPPPGKEPMPNGGSPPGPKGNDFGGHGETGGSAPHGGGPNLDLPPGTYGERLDSSLKRGGHVLVSFGQSAPPAPAIPAHIPVDELFTVGSVGSSGLRYRVYVSHDPTGAGYTLVAAPMRELDQTLSHLLLVEVLVVVGVLAALGLTAFFVVKLGLRPLNRMEVTAGEIAAGALDRRVSPSTQRTEIGRLGLALNAMLERLEQAFAARAESEERLRSFLADASHELRTPLASIRGYAELFRMGATADPTATATAMRRIEEESKRMGILVEDLLTLARLDHTPERDFQRVDLTMLAHDAVMDARASAPDRSIELSAGAPAVVSGDPMQLRQVLANLLGNALAHTPAGTAIEVTLSAHDDTVTIVIRDHGPGIPRAARERLFERFWRAEKGRERGRAGAGLGLAIVSAIVDAHHGSIGVHDAPGGGAAFSVELPAAALTGGVGDGSLGES